MKNNMILKYKKLDPNIPDFKRHSDGAAGFDLYNKWPVLISSGEILPNFHQCYKHHTGIAVEIPEGYCGLIKGRSSFNDKIIVMDSVIDSDYRGEIHIQILGVNNNGFYEIPKYTRIAQLLIVPCIMGEAIEVNELTETRRGTNGFGSTN